MRYTLNYTAERTKAQVKGGRNMVHREAREKVQDRSTKNRVHIKCKRASGHEDVEQAFESAFFHHSLDIVTLACTSHPPAQVH